MLINSLCPPTSDALIWPTGVYNGFKCYPCCPYHEKDLVAKCGSVSSQPCVEYKLNKDYWTYQLASRCVIEYNCTSFIYTLAMV